MPKGKYKMPNECKSSMPGKKSGTNTGACTGLKMSNEMRKDTTQKPSSKNPYPNGMA